MLDLQFFLKIGPRVRDRYRDHIFRNAKDVFGKPFSSNYSEPYKTNKSQGKFKRFEKAKLNAPVLTGDLLRDYGMIGNPSNTGFKIGWSIWGRKVEALKKLGRVLTTPQHPMPDGVIKYLHNEAHGYIKKRLGLNKTTTYKIGRK